jgi:ATP-dependent DNA ligase
VAHLPTNKVIIDGEIISADANGHPSFGALQDDPKRGRHDGCSITPSTSCTFDGFDTRPAPLIGRKCVLQGCLAEAEASALRVL